MWKTSETLLAICSRSLRFEALQYRMHKQIWLGSSIFLLDSFKFFEKCVNKNEIFSDTIQVLVFLINLYYLLYPSNDMLIHMRNCTERDAESYTKHIFLSLWIVYVAHVSISRGDIISFPCFYTKEYTSFHSIGKTVRNKLFSYLIIIFISVNCQGTQWLLIQGSKIWSRCKFFQLLKSFQWEIN